jgi:hypothetical protein
MIRASAILYAVMSMLASSADAQSIATLKGRVTDASGAIVRGATITARREDTGTQRSATSDSAGEYQLPFLAVGAYRIDVRSPGFRSEVLSRLVVEVGRTIVLDFQLNVGDVAETVTIVSEAPLIQRSIALGESIDQRTLESIPLNGRKVLQLALLSPGAMTPPQAGALTTPSRAQGSQAINSAGHREGTANFQVNGVTLNDQLNNILIFQPPIDSVEGFRIDNISPQVDYGRNSGATINIATRSGTNQLHGGGVEFFRHDALDAPNAFNTGAEAPFERHQFGAHLGGPVVRNRTFFFATYEGLRQEQGLPVNSVVLSDSQRMAVTHPVISRLLDYIPRATRSTAEGLPGSSAGRTRRSTSINGQVISRTSSDRRSVCTGSTRSSATAGRSRSSWEVRFPASAMFVWEVGNSSRSSTHWPPARDGCIRPGRASAGSRSSHCHWHH